MPETPHLTTLRTWADARGLSVQVSSGTQREPENVVAITDGSGPALLKRQSLDSIDTAALYLINTIERLRLDA